LAGGATDGLRAPRALDDYVVDQATVSGVQEVESKMPLRGAADYFLATESAPGGMTDFEETVRALAASVLNRHTPMISGGRRCSLREAQARK
jgi:hypothetical protein